MLSLAAILLQHLNWWLYLQYWISMAGKFQKWDNLRSKNIWVLWVWSVRYVHGYRDLKHGIPNSAGYSRPIFSGQIEWWLKHVKLWSTILTLSHIFQLVKYIRSNADFNYFYYIFPLLGNNSLNELYKGKGDQISRYKLDLLFFL